MNPTLLAAPLSLMPPSIRTTKRPATRGDDVDPVRDGRFGFRNATAFDSAFLAEVRRAEMCTRLGAEGSSFLEIKMSATLRRLRWANGRPPHFNGARNETIQPSAAEAEEVRLAQQELDRWQDAFDRNRGGENPDRYHSEIRFAELRLRSAISSVARARGGSSSSHHTGGST